MAANITQADELRLSIATAGTPVAAAFTVRGGCSQVMVSNSSNGWARFGFGLSTTAAEQATYVEPASGGLAPGFSLAPGAQIIVSVPAGITFAYANGTVAGDVYFKPISDPIYVA